MNHIDVDEYDPIDEPTGDRLFRLVRAVVGLSPVASGTILEVWNSLVEDPLQKRRTQWLRDLSGALNKCKDEIEKIKSDHDHLGVILSVILQSTDIAIKTGDQTIHERLIAIVLRTINDQQPSEELLSIYLATIRQMTSSHLALLGWISSRQRYEYGDDLKDHERMFFEAIEENEAISPNIPQHRLLKDLESLSLIYSPAGSPWSSNNTNYCTMTLTPFGKTFIDYLSNPAS